MSLSNLAKYIDGTSKEYKIEELAILFNDLNPEIVSYVTQGMIDKKLPPTKVLSGIIPLVKDSYGITLVALSLRLGANSNVYIQVPEIGDIHVLGLVSRLKDRYDPKVFIILVAILLSFGSKASSPLFNQSSSLLKDKPVSGISVADFNYNNGYGDELMELSKDGALNNINPQVRTEIAMFTDKVELIGSYITDADIELAILAQSKNIISAYVQNHKASDGNLMKLYDLVIKYYAANVPTELLKVRTYPHYYQVNHLILKMKDMANQGYQTLLMQLTGILKTLVIAGMDIDPYQLVILKTISPNIAKVITDAYAVPYWKKACEYSSRADANQRLIQLAKALQYNGGNTSQEVCTFIKKVSESDQQRILQSAVTRQKERIAILNSSPSDFINSKPSGVCHNATISGDEIYEYSDLDLITYKDSHGNIYCFTRDLFPILLQDKINPYTKEPLPSSFLEALAKQQAILTNLGMQGPPETLGHSLKRLHANDEITDAIDNSYIEDFLKLGRLNGLNDEALLSLAPPLTTTMLNNLGYNVIMEPLVPKHQYVTFVRTFMEDYKETARAQAFFEYLKIAYSNPQA